MVYYSIMYNANQLSQLFETYRKAQHLSLEPQKLYQPINYLMDNGGKRVRPVLLLLAVNMFQGDVNKAMPLAYALELFHNFTLMHDDIMDEAALRRGKPAVHKAFGLSSAILSGDVMQLLVYDYFKNLDDKTYREIISTFNEKAIKVCEGQQWDMDFETTESVSIDAYINMIAHKTAALLAGSLKMGALFAGATPQQSELLHNFGLYMGICFQLQDDILDTFGDPEKFGKTVGGDILNDKKTYLLIKAIELAKGELAEKLNYYRKANDVSDAEKVEAITAVLNSLDVKAMAEAEMKSYYNKAQAALNQLDVSKDKKDILFNYAESIYSRKY